MRSVDFRQAACARWLNCGRHSTCIKREGDYLLSCGETYHFERSVEGASVNPAKRFALLWCFSILVGLFKAFVLLNLWNWFVVDAFHVSPISYLPMLGVVWFIQLATASPNNDAGFLWKRMHALIGFCV